MRRKILLLLAILVFGSFLFYVGFVQHDFKKTFHTAIPVTSAMEQFSSPEKLIKWFQPFNSMDKTDSSIDLKNKSISAGNYQLQVFNQSMYSSILKFSNDKKSKEFLFSAIPDTSSLGGTEIIMLYKNSYLNEWLFKKDLDKKALNSFTDFKDYLDDSQRMYGYEIKPVAVADTLFLFERRTVPLAERRKATKTVFDNLIKYAAAKQLNYNGNRIFYYQVSEENVTLYASIGISKDISIPEKEVYEIKRMPFGKKLLEASYQGKFGEGGKVIEILKKYISDYNLSTMGIPFVKFITDGYDFAEDQIVQLKVYYPIL